MSSGVVECSLAQRVLRPRVPQALVAASRITHKHSIDDGVAADRGTIVIEDVSLDVYSVMG